MFANGFACGDREYELPDTFRGCKFVEPRDPIFGDDPECFQDRFVLTVQRSANADFDDGAYDVALTVDDEAVELTCRPDPGSCEQSNDGSVYGAAAFVEREDGQQLTVAMGVAPREVAIRVELEGVTLLDESLTPKYDSSATCHEPEFVCQVD